MIGGIFNLIIVAGVSVQGVSAADIDQKNPKNDIDHQAERKALQLILGAPMVPAVLLLIALSWCMESPRYYMRRNTPNYNPRHAP